MDPVLHLSSHFDQLKNQVDIAAQTHLLNSPKSYETNIFSNQATIIDQITIYESQCLHQALLLTKNSQSSSLFLSQTVYFTPLGQFNFLTNSTDQFGHLIYIEDEFFPNQAFEKISFNFTLDSQQASNEFIRLTILASSLLTASKTSKSANTIRLRLNMSERQSLSLRSLNLDSIEPISIKESGLNNLKIIDFSFNRLLHIDRCLFSGLENTLKSIDMSRNQRITELDSFQDLSNLETLNLSFIQIRKINANTFRGLGNLKQLDLAHNYSLTELEKNVFNSLDQLVSLNISNCEFIKFDKKVFENLKNLVSLDISGNQFETLQVDIFQGLVNLKTLDISSNLITSLPETIFFELTSLVVVNLSNNCLRNICPSLFRRLTNLSSVFLSDNRLTRFDKSLFTGLFYLKVVDLSFNRINLVNLNSLKGLRELKIFKLNDNLVSVIEVGFFEGLVGLVEVDLANNRLTELKVDVFKGLDKLQLINLYGNDIDQTMFGLKQNVHINWNKTYTN